MDKKGLDYVNLDEIKNGLFAMLPVNYTTYISNEPSLEKDLEILESDGFVISRKYIDSNTTTLGGDVKKEYLLTIEGA